MPDERQHASAKRVAAYDVERLRRFAGATVCVRLSDGSSWTGSLRTELLTDRSVAVYLHAAGQEGATLYIDQIVEIVDLPTATG